MRSDIDIRQWSDLRGYMAGFMRDDLTTEHSLAPHKLDATRVTPLTKGLELLMNGRLDIFVTNTTSVELTDLSEMAKPFLSHRRCIPDTFTMQ